MAVRILASRDGGEAILEPTVADLPALLAASDAVAKSEFTHFDTLGLTPRLNAYFHAWRRVIG